MQRRAPSWSTLALALSNLNTSHPVQIFAGALACRKEDSEGRAGQDSPIDFVLEISLESPTLCLTVGRGGPNSLLSCYQSVSELKRRLAPSTSLSGIYFKYVYASGLSFNPHLAAQDLAKDPCSSQFDGEIGPQIKYIEYL